MSVLVAAYPPRAVGCEVDGCATNFDGTSAYPVVEMVVDGTDATRKACAMCVALAWERVTGWRFANLLTSMRLGSEMGHIARETNKAARRKRKPKSKRGDGLPAPLANTAGGISGAAVELLDGTRDDAAEYDAQTGRDGRKERGLSGVG